MEVISNYEKYSELAVDDIDWDVPQQIQSVLFFYLIFFFLIQIFFILFLLFLLE